MSTLENQIINAAFIELIQYKLGFAKIRELEGDRKSAITWLEDAEADIATRAKELREDLHTRPVTLKSVK